MRKSRIITSILVVVFCLALSAPLLSAQEDGPVNINAASAEELASLKHVGEKLAQKIIEYREKNGRFNSPEEIMNVSGIGEKVFETNKDRIVVD